MKSRKVIAAVVGLAFLLQSCPLWAKEQKKPGPEKHYRLEWGDLAAIIADQKVSLVLPDATRLQGKVLAVEAQALALDITKTSDRRAHPKGRASIPRTSVSVLRLSKPGGHVWQIVGGILGTFGGLAAGGLLAWKSDNFATQLGIVVGAGALGGVGGWWGGRVSDRRTLVIEVVPEPPKSAQLKQEGWER